MPRLLFTALALLMAPAVSAQETARQPVRIEITKIDCSRLVRHYPRDDVAFRPGEGVGGRKVAPADLPGSGGMDVLPEVMEIPLIVQVRRPAGVDEAPFTAGVVAYDTRRGTFTINGRPMGSEDQSALAEACARRGVK